MDIKGITKISKMDTRCLYIGKFLYERSFYISEGFYSDGQFRYKIFSRHRRNTDGESEGESESESEGESKIGAAKCVFFLIKILPKTFIEYVFSVDNRMDYIRFWITEDKCEVPVDDIWVVKSTI